MPTFVVRLKGNGRIFSRHYETNEPELAAEKARRACNGRVISVKKVGIPDVIGTIKSMNLEDIIGVPPKIYNPQDGTVFENTTVGDILFPTKQQPRKISRARRRYYREVNKDRDKE